MSADQYDVIVLKEFEAPNKSGVSEKRTIWNRVGMAWAGKTDSMCFELFLFPGQRYVIKLRNKEENDPAFQTQSENQ